MKANARIYFLFFLSCVCFGQAPFEVQHVNSTMACVWETIHANCGPNKVIMIVEALHGRMRNGSRCFSLRSGELPCSADVRLFAEKKCAGRRRCSFSPIDDNLRYASGNCTQYDEKFLNIIYRCEAVYSADNETCIASQALIVRLSSDGYLANIITEETGKGSSICPWRIEPSIGQTVHLTLLDFGVWKDRGERDRRDICHIYATIRHLGSGGTPDTLICSGDRREKSVMKATTNIEIQMTNQRSSSEDAVYFLIKFQMLASDCPDFETPPGARVTKSGSGFRVYCYEDSMAYLDLRCEAGHWIPPLNLNCTTSSTISPSSTPVSSSSSSLCSDYNISNDVSSVRSVTDFRLLVACLNGDAFEVSCYEGKWISLLNKTCSTPTPHQTDPHLFPWEKYVVPGGLVLLAVVVVVIAVIMCKSRRRNKEEKMNKLVPQSIDNNSYNMFPLLDSDVNCGQMIDIYDELDESGIEDNGNIAPLPVCSSSNSVCGSSKHSKTLPRIDPWTGRSLERRPDTLPLHRKLPESNEYTTPLARDSTYLVPQEDLCDPLPHDTVPSRGRI